jgi:hypothetical protein
VDRQLARKQIARTTVLWELASDDWALRRRSRTAAQQTTKQRERTIPAIGQTRSKWQAISSRKAAGIKGTRQRGSRIGAKK